MSPAEFPWRPGMLAISPANGGRYRLVRDVDGRGWWATMTETTTESRGRVDYCTPDPTDGATRGAFLDAVREAYGDAEMYASRWCDRWAVSRGNDNILVTAATEWDAIAAAWAARPGGGGA